MAYSIKILKEELERLKEIKRKFEYKSSLSKKVLDTAIKIKDIREVIEFLEIILSTIVKTDKI